MSMRSEKEKIAKKLFDLGNYKSSGKLYDELNKNSKNNEDCIYFKNNSDICKENYEKVLRLSYGEAFFPVIGQADRCNSVLTLRITNNPASEKLFDIEKVKVAVIKFLDEYLFQEIKTIMVLDWKVDDLMAEIKNIPNMNDYFRSYTDSIEGRSLELAAAVAIISKLLDLKISSEFVFTGAVEAEGNNIELVHVDNIKEKLDCIKEERPGIKYFIAPGSSKISDKIIITNNTLKEVVSRVFKNFKIEVEKSLLEKKEIEMITLKINKSKNEHKKDVLVFNFQHPSIQENDIKKISEFLCNIGEFIKGRKEGIIIDGLRFSCLSPMLLSMQNVANHISNFVAVRFTQDGNFAKAAVVRTNNKNTSTFKVGDTFSYEIPQK